MNMDLCETLMKGRPLSQHVYRDTVFYLIVWLLVH